MQHFLLLPQKNQVSEEIEQQLDMAQQELGQQQVVGQNQSQNHGSSTSYNECVFPQCPPLVLPATVIPAVSATLIPSSISTTIGKSSLVQQSLGSQFHQMIPASPLLSLGGQMQQTQPVMPQQSGGTMVEQIDGLRVSEQQLQQSQKKIQAQIPEHHVPNSIQDDIECNVDGSNPSRFEIYFVLSFSNLQ